MQITIGQETYNVVYTEDPNELCEAVFYMKPTFFTYDTESTGLHIKKDRPFWGAICFETEVYGKQVYVFPTNKEMLTVLMKISQLVKRVYCHNTTYDMHMTANIIGDAPVLSVKNWGDTMGLCRLTFESISTRDGGDSLSLKKIAKKYLDPTADRYEKEVKGWLSLREREQNKLFTAMVKPMKWSYSKIKDAFKTGEEIPQDVLDTYALWQQHNPRPNYQDVPQEIMLPYLASDVILTKMLVERGEKSVAKKQQTEIMEKEFNLIPVIFKMERIGFKLDREYLKKSQVLVEAEIERVKNRAFELAGQQFKSGQHQLIKKLYEEITEEKVDSVDKLFLKGMTKDGDELAPVIMKWRSLEKWLQTYIIRLLEASEYDGRLYTTLGQFNPVSGRFSGDAQQFPKKALYTEEGDKIAKTGKKPPQEMELYHPRRAIVISGEGYNSMYYLDFSQVELRVQGHYTLSFGGDINLCRAYMPFRCTHYTTGEIYDYTSLEGRKRWMDYRDGHPTDVHWEDILKAGWSAWIVPETGEPWKPTDVHSATTIKALNLLGMDVEAMNADDFAVWRGIGKGYNFSKNYGVGALTASQQLGITIEEAEAMGKGYVDAFPKVIDYQNYVSKVMWDRGFVRNLYGRRYYVKSSNRFYKCANYLIQGTCADDLKNKMILIDNYLQENKCKSRMVMCIHDEIQYEVWEGEEWIIPEIKEIMEYTPSVLVPIVSDVEKTTGTWADKKKVIGI